MSEKVKAVISLTIICLVVSTMVVFTYQITKPYIERSANKASFEAMELVLPETTKFQELALSEEFLDAYHCTFLRKSADSNAIAVQIETKGYQSGLVVMIGIKENGAISAVKVVQHSETEGIGTRAMSEEYLNKYKQKRDTSGIELVSGATYTSNGIKTAIEFALKLFDEIKEELNT